MRSVDVSSAQTAGGGWSASPRPAEAAPADPGAVGADLRRMFDDVTREPMPDRLLALCDRLEDAFHRGDLYRCGGPRRA